MSELAVVFNNVSKHFGSLKAVDNVSFEIPLGAICGLLGPNGAGKTTSFRMLGGYLKPTAGTISIFGHSPGSKELLHGRVLALPQDATLPPHSTIHHFLCYLGKLQGLSGKQLTTEVDRVLELVALTEAAKQTGKSMSHGMARRVALASTLMGNPELIMLDEPTGGLDPRNANAVRNLIKNLNGKCTVIIASHNLAEVQEICTHAAIIGHGKLSAFGTVADICQESQHLIITLGQDELDLNPLKSKLPMLNFKWKKDNNLLVDIPANCQEPLPELTRQILATLIEQKADITTLQRGESLEKRFLELT